MMLTIALNKIVFPILSLFLWDSRILNRRTRTHRQIFEDMNARTPRPLGIQDSLVKWTFLFLRPAFSLS
jgi:hypothetical protein